MGAFLPLLAYLLAALLIGVVVFCFFAKAPVYRRRFSEGTDVAPPSREDLRILEWLAADAAAATGLDPHADALTMRRLAEAVEEARRSLETAETVVVDLPFFAAGPEGPIHFKRTVTRDELARAVRGALV